MNNIIEEAQKKLDEALNNFKVKQIASILNRKAQLEQEIIKLEAKIEEVSKITIIPEGQYFDF
jgi:hypothetical protein